MVLSKYCIIIIIIIDPRHEMLHILLCSRHSVMRLYGGTFVIESKHPIFTYFQICQFINNPGAQVVYSEEQQGIYAYNGDQWVGYDDSRSLQAKVGECYKWQWNLTLVHC